MSGEHCPVEAGAAEIWNNSGPVLAGVRPRWAEAVEDFQWARPVRHTRDQARYAVRGARRALAAELLTEAADNIETSGLGRHHQYTEANRHDAYRLRVLAAQHLDGER